MEKSMNKNRQKVLEMMSRKELSAEDGARLMEFWEGKRVAPFWPGAEFDKGVRR